MTMLEAWEAIWGDGVGVGAIEHYAMANYDHDVSALLETTESLRAAVRAFGLAVLSEATEAGARDSIAGEHDEEAALRTQLENLACGCERAPEVSA